MKHLKKIEELTLHLIEKDEELKVHQIRADAQEERLSALEKRFKIRVRRIAT